MAGKGDKLQCACGESFQSQQELQEHEAICGAPGQGQ